MEWNELLKDVLKGYKRLLIVLAWLVVCACLLWGMLSIILIASGRIPFSWWYLPCWVMLLTAIAAAIGSYEGR